MKIAVALAEDLKPGAPEPVKGRCSDPKRSWGWLFAYDDGGVVEVWTEGGRPRAKLVEPPKPAPKPKRKRAPRKKKSEG